MKGNLAQPIRGKSWFWKQTYTNNTQKKATAMKTSKTLTAANLIASEDAINEHLKKFEGVERKVPRRHRTSAFGPMLPAIRSARANKFGWPQIAEVLKVNKGSLIQFVRKNAPELVKTRTVKEVAAEAVTPKAPTKAAKKVKA